MPKTKTFTSGAPTRSSPAASGNDTAIANVRAVDRAIDILQCFTPDHPQMSVIDIQKRVGLSRPTLYRLLATLAGKGLIIAEGEPQRFRLAHGVMRLAHVWLAGLDIANAARPLVEALRDASGETAALFVIRGEERLCVLEYPSRHVLAISRGVGDTGHITQGASGKAILAFLDERRRENLVGQHAPAARAASLLKELATTRREGFAISRGEVFAGAVAIAAPFFDASGDVAGSIGLFGPSARLAEKRIAELARDVIAAAHTLSVQNGAPTKQKARSVG